MKKTIPCTTRKQGELVNIDILTQDFAGKPLLSIKVIAKTKSSSVSEAAE
jgi:hypothetical protein